MIHAYLGAPGYVRPRIYVFPTDPDDLPHNNQSKNKNNGNDCEYRISKGGRRIYKRKRIGERMRKVVASEQEWRCNNCGMLLNASFEIDHIVPVSSGGSSERENLVAY